MLGEGQTYSWSTLFNDIKNHMFFISCTQSRLDLGLSARAELLVNCPSYPQKCVSDTGIGWGFGFWNSVWGNKHAFSFIIISIYNRHLKANHPNMKILTMLDPQCNLNSLWQRLWTKTLQRVHLKPWRPNPHIRSAQ